MAASRGGIELARVRRQPFSENLIMRTKDGIRVQAHKERWLTHDERDAEPVLRVTETHGDSVVTLPADSQVRVVCMVNVAGVLIISWCAGIGNISDCYERDISYW